MSTILKSIFVLFFAVFLTACGGDGSSSKTASKKWRIMPLGDSITFDDARAYYDSNGKNLVPAGKRTAYRSFLAYDLDDAGVNYDFVGSQRAGYSVEPPFDPDNEGHPGWTSREVASHIYGWLTDNPADIVLLHIGTNDHSTSIAGTKKVISEIKRFAKDHKMKIKVFVALIINRWLYDYTIEDYNKNLEAYLDSLNDPDIIKVNMQDMLSGRAGDYLENTHPSKSGYKKIADKWFSAIIDYVQ